MEPRRILRWLIASRSGRAVAVALLAVAVAAPIAIIGRGPRSSPAPRPQSAATPTSISSSPSNSPVTKVPPATTTPSMTAAPRPRWNGYAPWQAYAGRDGRIGNDSSFAQSVSANGRWVAFASLSSNLVRGDTNADGDVFVKDRATGKTTRVSVSSTGRQSNSGSGNAAISADGRLIAFASRASNLVRGDTNGDPDVFVHDQLRHTTIRISVSSFETQANRESGRGLAISSDGRYAAFDSDATNLVPGDTNRKSDVFLRDRVAGITSRVSLTPEGTQANGDSEFPSISYDGSRIAFISRASNLDARGGTVCGTNGSSPCNNLFLRDVIERTTTTIVRTSPGTYEATLSGNGRFLAFTSRAEDLVPGDTNGASDVFVFDISNARTTRVSISSSGEEGNDASGGLPAISRDGRYVAFKTEASNLVPNDVQMCGGFYEDEPIYSCSDIVLRDRTAGITTLVSVTTSGAQANWNSFDAFISADGRHVVFTSQANNITSDKPASCAAESPGCENVYVHDRLKATTRAVSTASPRR